MIEDNTGNLNNMSMNRRNLSRLNAAGEAILNAQGETLRSLVTELISSYDESASENLIRLYARADMGEAKSELAYLVGSFSKEQGLLVLLDHLYSQQIGNDSIRAILKQHSLLANIDLEPAECDAIVSTMLNFLRAPLSEIESMDDERKFRVDIINRTSAARILVVLNGYPNTSKISKAKMRNNRNLIVTYYCTDVAREVYVPKTLDDYLSDRIG